MTLCGIVLLAALVLFTAVDLAGFWIICRKDREGFLEGILLVIINIGTVVVSWAIMIATIMERGIA